LSPPKRAPKRGAKRPRARARTGIDTGGTFTDFVVHHGDRVLVRKVLSTPDDPARAVLIGIDDLFQRTLVELATELGMHDVLIPCHLGLLSAFGMADAGIARDHVVTVRAIDPAPAELARRLAALTARARAELRADGVIQRHVVAFGFARVRYAGQSHEIEVPFTQDYRRRFDAAHRRLYGHASADRPVEVLGLRLTVSEREPAARSRRATIRRRPASGGARHPLVWRGRRMDVARYEREALPPAGIAAATASCASSASSPTPI
jgi:N-methylhydantoinase A/oxoprolinase/acetone carboxylase beta subunit